MGSWETLDLFPTLLLFLSPITSFPLGARSPSGQGAVSGQAMAELQRKPTAQRTLDQKMGLLLTPSV